MNYIPIAYINNVHVLRDNISALFIPLTLVNIRKSTQQLLLYIFILLFYNQLEKYSDKC